MFPNHSILRDHFRKIPSECLLPNLITSQNKTISSIVHSYRARTHPDTRHSNHTRSRNIATPTTNFHFRSQQLVYTYTIYIAATSMTLYGSLYLSRGGCHRPSTYAQGTPLRTHTQTNTPIRALLVAPRAYRI